MFARRTYTRDPSLENIDAIQVDEAQDLAQTSSARRYTHAWEVPEMDATCLLCCSLPPTRNSTRTTCQMRHSVSVTLDLLIV